MAIMVHEGLFVGNASDLYKFAGSILHCARDPWFVEAIEKTNGQFMTAREFYAEQLPQANNTVIRANYNEMALNMVDAESPKYFSDEMVNAGLEFITERMAEGDACLVHCNMGVSRSPSMTFLWMFEHGFLDDEFQYAVPQFREIYKDWAPANGIWQYLERRCKKPTISDTISS